VANVKEIKRNGRKAAQHTDDPRPSDTHSGRGLGHATQFQNFGTLQYFGNGSSYIVQNCTWRVHENPHNLHAQCALASYKATSPINALSKYWPCFRTQRSTKFKPNLAHSRPQRDELLTSALISKLEGQCH